ncbi:hypothetical protein VNO80_11644 [Phaseolus coccineus]|uniref:Uncharacterized protein n=1 Tax=Phaseolus coccineus TaxID=3886 RepID=A0AAN9RF52_PHACN
MHSLAQQVQESICANDKKAVYQLILKSDVDLNAIRWQSLSGDSFDMASQTENQLVEDEKDGSSALHLACLTSDTGMVELLLQLGADINASDSRGRTPLHCCIIKGQTAAAKALILRGANIYIADKEGNTPVKLASESGCFDTEIIKLLTSR